MERKTSEVTKGTKYEKLRKEVNELEDVILKLSDYTNLDSDFASDNFYQNLKVINTHQTNLKNFEIPKKLDVKLGKYIANRFIEIDSIKIFTKCLDKMTSEILKDEDDSEIDINELSCISEILVILINNADADLNFGKKICENDDLLKLFYKILDKFKEEIVNDGSPSFYGDIVPDVVNILYNTLIHESTYNIMKMREYNFLEIIKNFVECESNLLNIMALLFTSYVIDEINVDMIAGDKKLLCRIISVLEESIEKKFIHGFSTEELAKGILQLSRNDENKLLLVNYKILPLLNQLLDKKSIKIQKTSLLILWSLAFLDSNKKKIKRKFLTKIENMRNNLDKVDYKEIDTAEFSLYFKDIININSESENEIDGLRHTLDRVLWVLKNEETSISNEVFIKTSEDMIMISYSHKDEQIVKKMYYELKKKGYKLWIDFENMTDKIMESMALAVEQSKAVIICGSYNYQRSEFCRQEMTYAQEHKKTLIPLIVEKNFTPTGWLGISLTGILRFTLSGKYDFETSMSKLVEHLDRQVINKLNKGIDECDNVIQTLAVITHENPSNKVSELASWTNSDVMKWFQKIGITTMLESLYSLFV